MKVREWLEQHPEVSCYYAIWAADTNAGFGRKGDTVYGDNRNCDIIRIETHRDGKTPVLVLWFTEVWGPCPED